MPRGSLQDPWFYTETMPLCRSQKAVWNPLLSLLNYTALAAPEQSPSQWLWFGSSQS